MRAMSQAVILHFVQFHKQFNAFLNSVRHISRWAFVRRIHIYSFSFLTIDRHRHSLNEQMKVRICLFGSASVMGADEIDGNETEIVMGLTAEHASRAITWRRLAGLG